jgi:flagellar biosynthesis protein FlhB
MSGENKHFPISDVKRERLRAEGTVLLTADVFHAVLLLGLLIGGTIFCRGLGAEIVGLTKEIYGSTAFSDELLSTLPLQEELGKLARILLLSLAAFLIPSTIILYLSGFLQTRFLFKMSLFSFDPSRLFGLSRFAPSEFVSRVFVALGYLLRLAAYVVILGLVLRFIFLQRQSFESSLPSAGPSAATNYVASTPTTYSLMTPDPQAILPLVNTAIGLALSIAVSFLALGLFFAVGSRFIDVFSFRRHHMMTRAEVEEEMRELEQQNELREAQDLVRENLVDG